MTSIRLGEIDLMARLLGKRAAFRVMVRTGVVRKNSVRG